MARVDYTAPDGSTGWVDSAAGQGYNSTAGAFTFTPGANAMAAVGGTLSVNTDRPGLDAAGPIPGAGGGSQSSGGLSGVQAGNAATISSFLRQYGLDALLPEVDSWARQNLTWDQIYVQLLDPSTGPGKVVDTIYPEIRLRREAGGVPLTIGDILNYRETVKQMFQQAGLPTGYYDQPSDFTDLIVKDVSPAELQARVNDGFLHVANAPPEVRAELSRLYGVNDGDLAAYFLDESKALPLLQRQVAAADISGAGVRTGFGGLSTSEAEGLAAQGVSPSQAQQGFSTLAQSSELFSPLNSGEDTIGRSDQLGAVFGNNAAAQRRIAQRQQTREAAFQGGGGFSTSRDGYAGLSTTRS